MPALSLVPVIGNARAADEPYLSVNDYKLAVSAIVDARQRVQAHRVIPGDPPACLAEFFEIAVPRGKAADCVEHYVDAHARACALCERFVEAAGALWMAESSSS